MDVLAVREAMRFCADYVRAGNGPLVMETATYRYHGHSMSDPGTSYRTRDEIAEVRATRDPIGLFKDRIITSNLATAAEIKKLEQEVRKEVDTATQKAKTDAELPLEELYTHVYRGDDDMLVRTCEPMVYAKHRP
ncbi:PREDICTED: pyruvate dehydrogenase E1 component subunit alpha, testis-specific form, mitochondrial-like [Priapulus caudatus]|uniref:Pyruvate dehydrogenase E1 component subunit alpha, testis-specific form, mitochondrial-like n=1 Tax=Priapulus caudatus TaxID=37621 RepID=A0ABM1F2Z5_PRICU|nr:PREDICTED: pyruvate dehydrogenase E1 component subunit alpha, testis-specific form, mitochondrial-like [Priapulus caudatus]